MSKYVASSSSGAWLSFWRKLFRSRAFMVAVLVCSPRRVFAAGFLFAAVSRLVFGSGLFRSSLLFGPPVWVCQIFRSPFVQTGPPPAPSVKSFGVIVSGSWRSAYPISRKGHIFSVIILPDRQSGRVFAQLSQRDGLPLRGCRGWRLFRPIACTGGFHCQRVQTSSNP